MNRRRLPQALRPEVTPLEERALLSRFNFTLMPVNNSGVSGQGTIVRHGDKIKVTMDVNGLEPNLFHMQHIHGFGDPRLNTAPEFRLPPTDHPSAIAPPSAAALIPATPDLIPPLVSSHQAEIFAGPEMVDLTLGNATTIYPAADATGHLHYQQTLDAKTPTGRQLSRLDWRAIEVHGAYVATDAAGNHMIVHATNGSPPPGATYSVDIPVAAGQITPSSTRPAHRRG